jgi:hypothetical protein
MLERDLRGILHLLVPRPSCLRQKRKWADDLSDDGVS